MTAHEQPITELTIKTGGKTPRKIEVLQKDVEKHLEEKGFNGVLKTRQVKGQQKEKKMSYINMSEVTQAKVTNRVFVNLPSKENEKQGV